MLLQDLRFALRSFLRAPRFTVPAVLALALGIGATSAIFSVVRGVMLEPLPYRDPERIVSIWENSSRSAWACASCTSELAEGWLLPLSATSTRASASKESR